MRSKLLPLLAAAALLGLLALAGSAAAVTITTPVAGTAVTFTSTNFKMTDATGTWSCTSNVTRVTVNSTTGATVTNPITTMTFSGCTTTLGTTDVLVMNTTGGACTTMTLTLTTATTGDVNLGDCIVYIANTGGSCQRKITSQTLAFTWANSTQALSINQSGLTYDSSGGICGANGTATWSATYNPSTTTTVD